MIFFFFFFFFKQKTAYEMLRSLVGSEMCIRDRCRSFSRRQLRQTSSAVHLQRSPPVCAQTYSTPDLVSKDKTRPKCRQSPARSRYWPSRPSSDRLQKSRVEWPSPAIVQLRATAIAPSHIPDKTAL